MKNYELVCILDPQVSEGQYEPVVERYEAFIKENGGEITQIDNWGLRRLAYTSSSLKNRRQGYYVIYQFSAETTIIDALEQTLKLDESVLRYLVTNVEGDFIHVPQLAADNFLEEAFARPSRGPRDRGGPRRDRDDRGPRGRDDRGSRDRDDRGSRDRDDRGSRDRDDRGPKDRDDRGPKESEVKAPDAQPSETEGEAVAQESSDS